MDVPGTERIRTGLRRLLGTDAAEPVAGVMREAVTVEAHVPAEDAARLGAAEQLVALPVVDGTGGSTGKQAATTVTRALALGDVVVRDMGVRDVGRVGFREVRVRTLLGARLGAAGLLGVGAVYAWAVGAVIGLTLLVVSVPAATVGGLIPVPRGPPAVFSNPFITTLVDASGVIVYFLIASAVLGLCALTCRRGCAAVFAERCPSRWVRQAGVSRRSPRLWHFGPRNAPVVDWIVRRWRWRVVRWRRSGRAC
ncbi:magnesium transporter [Kocuria sp. M1R5S2]|uniref:magnesium transporter n=1 Tax=Kocuria rhizosphaerae TaxID=3376285 RepID=UPI0037BD595B